MGCRPPPPAPCRIRQINSIGSETDIPQRKLETVKIAMHTFEGANGNPSWTPDGKRIVFQSGQNILFWQMADGSGGREPLTSSKLPQSGDSWSPDSWSPDGQLLAFTELNSTTGRDISVLRLNDRTRQPFLRTPSNESAPRFSPDGRWLLYVSDESGRYEVYAQPFPGPGGSGKSRPKEARSRYGTGTEASCSTAAVTK